MKVIENNYNKKSKRIRCNNCNSILDYVKDDIKYSDEYCESYIVCPLCDYIIFVDELR